MNKLKKFFEVAKRIQAGLDVPDEDLEFYFSYAPEVNEEAIQKFLGSPDGKGLSQQDVTTALVESSKKLQADPIYKEQLLKVATEKKGAELSSKIAQGASLLLAGTDIANSVNQIVQSNQSLKKSRRPSRPVAPQRDQYLAQALRSAQESTGDVGRALAPVQAEIQDQYQNDLRNAQTASTGQAGAFGSYAQVAANRRNRSALELAPIQDSIRAREQARYDNLLGMRQQETQNMFQNQAQLYPYDLQQYGLDQQAGAQLGSTGRENLRNSLQNFAGQLAPAIGNFYKERKYRDIRNRAQISGLDADMVEKTNRTLDGYVNQDDINNLYSGYGDYYRYGQR